jgi:hypothetical protein
MGFWGRFSGKRRRGLPSKRSRQPFALPVTADLAGATFGFDIMC